MVAFVAAGAAAGSAVGARRRPALVARRRPAAAAAAGANGSTPLTMGEFTRVVDGVERRRVVVTGMGVASVFGTDVDVYYDKLLAGESGIKPIEAFDCDGWATRFAGEIAPGVVDATGYVSPKDARRMDPFLIYALVAGQKALESAGLGKDDAAFAALDKTKCGVLCASGMGGLKTLADGVEKLVKVGHKKMSPFFIPYAITNMASGYLGMTVGFMGPNYSISTACASSNFAMNNSAIHIMRGEAKVMVAGGSEAAIQPVGLGGFVACRALSTRNEAPKAASRPWDTARDGFVMGEGSGLIVLEDLEHAKARGAPIHAEYLGGAQSCDAYHITDPRKDGAGVRKCIEDALADAGVAKGDVNYINAHATSTPAGDMAEFRAVRSVFDGDVSGIKMNATKSMIGHALGAAGGLEGIALIKAITSGRVHPTINVENMDAGVDIDIVPNVAQAHDVKVALSNSFGFGGHNATVVFGKYVE